MTYDFWAERGRKNRPQQTVMPTEAKAWWMDTRREVNPSTDQPIAESHGLTPESMAVLDASTKSAKTVRKSRGECPECGGKNYASLGQVASEHGSFENKQCFDCGYPVRHDGVPSTGIATTGVGRARQVNSGGKVINNYHPKNTVAGRLS